MKILFVIDQLHSGSNGISISAVRFASSLRQSGHEVRIVTTGEKDENLYILPERHIFLATCFAHAQEQLFAKPKKDVLLDAIGWCDVVHFFMPWKLSKVGVKIAKQLNKPYTAAFHVQAENVTYNIGMGLGKSKLAINFVYALFRNTFYNKVGHIHCPSQFIANELKEHGYKSNLHVISNGINDCFSPADVEKPVEFKDKFVITMAARHSSEKRQDVLINAVAKSKYKDKIQLIFAGKGPKTKYYKKLAKKLPNPPVFDFYNQKDLIKILQFSDLYVHSADVEIEAVSCLEAIACGLVPIISTSPTSATQQFSKTDKSLFAFGNSDDLASKIDYWIENEEERHKYSKIYADFAQNFNIKTSVAKFEKMLQEAITENNKAIKEAIATQQSFDNEAVVETSIATKEN